VAGGDGDNSVAWRVALLVSVVLAAVLLAVLFVVILFALGDPPQPPLSLMRWPDHDEELPSTLAFTCRGDRQQRSATDNAGQCCCDQELSSSLTRDEGSLVLPTTLADPEADPRTGPSPSEATPPQEEERSGRRNDS
jgi:hypothetical protein